MLLLPIIRDISMRPVQVFTRITPKHTIVSQSESNVSLNDHQHQFYDIRIKLIRGESDAPGRPRINTFADKLPSKNSEPKIDELKDEEKDNKVLPKEAEALPAPVPPNPGPSLFSIGSLIGSLYYGGNKTTVSTTLAQQSTISAPEEQLVFDILSFVFT